MAKAIFFANINSSPSLFVLLSCFLSIATSSSLLSALAGDAHLSAFLSGGLFFLVVGIDLLSAVIDGGLLFAVTGGNFLLFIANDASSFNILPPLS